MSDFVQNPTDVVTNHLKMCGGPFMDLPVALAYQIKTLQSEVALLAAAIGQGGENIVIDQDSF